MFPSSRLRKNSFNYVIKYCKKPKWNAFIYSDKNTNNFSLINKTIQQEINKFKNIEDKNKKMENIEKEGSKNQMIIHFVSQNNSDNLLLEEFNKPKSRRSLNENFPLILFYSKILIGKIKIIVILFLIILI